MKSVLSWELLSGGKVYIILFLIFLLIYVAADYPPRKVGGLAWYDPSTTTRPKGDVRSVLEIGWGMGELWQFSFPVVIALAVYLFSYDVGQGLLRTYMLSQVSRTTLFVGKLAAMFIAIFLPMVVSGAFLLALADPTLFLKDPLLVWGDLGLRLLLYLLMMYLMIGFSVLPAVAFKKPLYAFVTPFVVLYALQRARLPEPVPSFIPPVPFLYYENPYDLDLYFRGLARFWGDAWPSLTIATIMLIAAYILFLKMDQP